LIPAVLEFVKSVAHDFNLIPKGRKRKLEEITDFVRRQIISSRPANLTFICTHNSRRSHMGQIWAQAATHFYNIKDVHCFSGGTEATAFNPRAVHAMREAGFTITKSSEDKNPLYLVDYATGVFPIKAFSKTYNDPFNPQIDYCAVMTCSDADEACPVVFGASTRVSIPYEDPKIADDTAEETAKYNERCRQIATEMVYLFSRVG
jgi:protein-tyrosine phosphatase/arsenate reductase